MNEEMLHYYNRELAYLRQMGDEFAKHYPKIAGRLRLTNQGVEDPHVSRLLEGVALLTAQIRQRLDDHFPEVPTALMGQMFPDYQMPLPSTAIIEITPRNLSTSSRHLPRGTTVILEEGGDLECRFKTCFELDLWPINVVEANFKNAPFTMTSLPWQGTPRAMLRLHLTPQVETVAWEALGVERLRFFLGGATPASRTLYERLLRNLIGIAVCDPKSGRVCQWLERRHLNDVGFADEEAALPYSQRAFSGYRLLTEHFVFSDKFLFVELMDLPACVNGIHHDIEFRFFFDEGSDELEASVNRHSLRLTCVPIVNLYEEPLEPIALAHYEFEHHMMVNLRCPNAHEIIQILNLRLDRHDGVSVPIPALYDVSTHGAADQGLYWTGRRQHVEWTGGQVDPGIEYYLSLVDDNGVAIAQLGQESPGTVFIQALCSNRNLPTHLPFGDKAPRVRIPDGAECLERVRLIGPPSPVVRPNFGDEARWQLVGHLSLTHFSGDDAAGRLKSVLRLYDFRKGAESRVWIDAIREVKTSQAMARVTRSGRVSMVAGTDVSIVFERTGFVAGDLFFFANLLSYFLSRLSAVNSFVRLTVWRVGDEQPYHCWPARSGSGALL